MNRIRALILFGIIGFCGCAAPRKNYLIPDTMDKKYEYVVGTEGKYFIIAAWDGAKDKWVYWKKSGNLQ